MVTTRKGSTVEWSPGTYGRAAISRAPTRSDRGAAPRPITRAERLKRQADMEEEEARAIADENNTRSVKKKKAEIMPPLPRRVLRPSIDRGHPTCADFGPYRKLLFPKAFFCSNCEWWEEELSLGNKRAFRRGAKFHCRAKHTSWIYPTEMVEKSFRRVSRSRQLNWSCHELSSILVCTIYEEDDEDDSDDEFCEEAVNAEVMDVAGNESSNDAIFAAARHADESRDNDAACVKEILQEELRRTRKQLSEWKAKYNDLKKESINASSTPIAISDSIIAVVGKVDMFVRTNAKRRKVARSIASSLLNLAPDCNKLIECIRSCLLDACRLHFRKTLFSPDKILRAMDMAGGQLSMEGLEVLRTLETGNKKWVRGTIIPCSSDIQRAAAVVETYASTICPYEHGYLQTGGEYIRFDPASVVKLALEAFQLTSVSKERSVSMAQSFDGAQLTKKLSHTTYGVKVTDRQAVSPFTNRTIFASADETTLQSRNHNLPIMMVMRNETKDVVEGFQETMKIVTSFGAAGSSALSAHCKPIKMAFNSDLSAGWKVRGIGGAAKRETMPCHCCPIKSDDLAVPNIDVCARFCVTLHQHRVGWKCYHQPFLSEEYTATLEEDLKETESSMGSLLANLDELKRNTTVHTDEDPRFASASNTNDALSIHFDFSSAERQERTHYSNIINKDLELRSLQISGRLAERQERLRSSLETEFKYRLLRDALAHGRKSEAHAIVTLHETVPCILHMENRVGLKLLTLLLMEGLDNALKAKTYTNINAEGARMRRFFADIETICNETIWGTEQSPTQWQCPRDETKKEVGTICLDNNKTRRVINELERLFEFCMPESVDQSSRYAMWQRCLPHYRQAMIIVRSKDDLSAEQSASFQEEIDCFFQIWVHLHGREGVTNYIHMLGAGHISEYIVFWGNLYSHSQQGWEAFNSLVKTYYFRRTARGGAGNRGAGLKSRVVPIARWLSRRMMWMSNVSYDDIKEKAQEEDSTPKDYEELEETTIGPAIDNSDIGS